MKRINHLTAEQLRKSILQLAIQGKLVSQKAEDGNAKDLLAEIKNEKAKLIKEGKIKKEKPLPEITDKEKTFEIPKSWCWCKLGDLGDFVRGAGIKRCDVVSSGFPCIRYGEMYTSYKTRFCQVKSFVNEEMYKKCYKIQKNDILMALTGENKQDIALSCVYEGEEKVAIGGDLCKFTPIKCNSLYLVYLINSPYGIDYKKESSTGDIIVHTSTGKLSNLFIPLPPLAEQKRIVEKIESLEPLLKEYEKYEKALTELDDKFVEKCKKSILQYAVCGKLVPQDPVDEPATKLLEKIRAERAGLIKQGKLKKDKNESYIYKGEDGLYYEKIGKAELVALKDLPFEIPESWVWVRLKTIADIFNGNSINEDEKRKKYTNIDGYDYIATKDVNFDKTINYANGVNIPYDTTFKIAPAGKILLCIEGGSAGRKIAITNKKVCFGNKLVCFDTLFIDDTFLFFILQSAGFLSIFKDSISGIIGGVSIGTLKEFLIPLPPLAEQKRIVVKIEEIFKELERIEKAFD